MAVLPRQASGIIRRFGQRVDNVATDDTDDPDARGHPGHRRHPRLPRSNNHVRIWFYVEAGHDTGARHCPHTASRGGRFQLWLDLRLACALARTISLAY